MLEKGLAARAGQRRVALWGLYSRSPSWLGVFGRRKARPKASIVVISYNMARELPRTIRSLSPALQRGVSAEDYEIIVVDNGSTQPFES